MLDYISSKTAYNEYEERVREQVPALAYDGWVRDDESESLSKRTGRLLLAVGNKAIAIGEQLIGEHAGEFGVAPVTQSGPVRHSEPHSS